MAQTRIKAGMIDVPVNAQTGTTYTYLATDRGKMVTHSNAAAIAATLPQATGSFAAGFSFHVKNLGVGTVTITPTTSTINGNTSVALATGDAAAIVSDGTNWIAVVTADYSDFAEVKKNYVVNPGMRISQENGTSSGTADGYYPADQFRMFRTTDGTLTAQQVASATPEGSTHRIRITVTVADTSLSAGQNAYFFQPLEGYRTADLKWGTASAEDIVIRFGWKSPAGTYALAVINQDNNRSFVREFTISGGEANTDTVQTLTIPGDTSGTWDTDNTQSIGLFWVIGTGSTYHTTAGAWQAGSYLGTASTTNGLATGSDVFELFDVGMYADPDSLGVAPPFELPHYADDLEECERYYCRKAFGIDFDGGGGGITGAVAFNHQVRAAPSRSTTATLSQNIASTNWETAAASIPYLGSLQVVSNDIGRAYYYGSVVFNARM